MLKPVTREALDLLMRGAASFSRIEKEGIRIDVPYLDRAIVETKSQIADMEAQIRGSEEYRVWAKHYGNRMNLRSRQQLGHVVFDILGHKRSPFIEGNNVAAFEHLKLPFVRNYQDVERLKKALSTNLLGIKREVVDGFVHPFQDLHTAESYRSSASKPNFHNMPIRNKRISEIVRTCVIPRNKNYKILEADYSTQEVRVSYCYNKDPKLLHDILHGDMHRDRAKELYILTDEEMGPNDSETGKAIRYFGKNRFVFAQFYGSYHAKCAPDLWDSISIAGLKTVQGVSLYKHLKSKGIKSLGACDPEKEPVKGTYEHHVKSVQDKMWDESYPVYRDWKKAHWDGYQRRGGINTLTGFRMDGVFRRNQILCDPIQGSAFHCLLWAVNEIVLKELVERKMKSRIILQVHDSTLWCVHKDEIWDVVSLVKEVAIERLIRTWKWIICPLAVEFDIGTENWFQKKPLQGA